MKTLIVAMNSKYIHASLAPWYLKASCGNSFGEIKVAEFTINEDPEDILGEIGEECADLIAFSCYIWNADILFSLADNVKKVFPRTKILFGGPEVSFHARETLERHPAVDYIITGEGEIAFRLVLERVYQGKNTMEGIDGLVFRIGDEIIENPSSLVVEDLDTIPSPYSDEMLAAAGNRIIYFESSRGCPFSCSYCLSSTTTGVRTFSLDRVKRELARLAGAGFRQVKFVDRTFNCTKDRAKEIFSWIIALDRRQTARTNFHFEVAADLFDEEMFEILRTAPPGLIQFEIGVQTTNPKTLESIRRKTDLEKLRRHVEILMGMGNIHLHLDLIAGLPYEDYASFIRSFNTVYALKPHQLQLGFLKLLKGSRIREEAASSGYRYRDYPPYEVLQSRWIRFEELRELKGVEDALDRYYNSGRFAHTLDFIEKRFQGDFFALYLALYNFLKTMGQARKAFPQRELYGHLAGCFAPRLGEEEWRIMNNLLKLDFLSNDSSSHLPQGLQREFDPGLKERCFEFLKDQTWRTAHLPQYGELPPKQLYKQVHFEIFDYDMVQAIMTGMWHPRKSILLFDYTQRDAITGGFPFQLAD